MLPVLCLSGLLLGLAPVPRAPRRARELKVLRDVAKVQGTLAKVQAAWSPGAGGGATGELYASLQRETGALVSDLRASQQRAVDVELELDESPQVPRWTSTVAPGRFEANSRYERELQALRAQASGLHEQVDMQREELALLEEAEISAEGRARQVFDAIDTDASGAVSLAEFIGAASIFSIDEAELERRFYQADTNGDGTLDFTEFAAFLASLRGDAIGPLRAARAVALASLLNTTLEMASLSLARDLTAAATDSRRLATLSNCVDRWCDLDSRSMGVVSSVVREGESANRAAQLEALLLEVGELAADLALANVTASVEWSVRRWVRLLATGARASLGFCLRGLRIMSRDVAESAALVAAAFRGRGLAYEDIAQIKRTVVDGLMLVPYAIIMIVPLSPPGHVFVFSVVNRVFPGAVPSAFTAQRQDINELYYRIAAEAADSPMMPPSLRLRRPALQRVASRVSSVARSVSSMFGRADSKRSGPSVA